MKKTLLGFLVLVAISLGGDLSDGMEAHKAHNYKKAKKLWKQSADRGNTIALSLLGVLYANGEGVKQDYTKAEKLYQKAADQGNAEAKYNFGLMYEFGEGVAQNHKKAKELFKKARNNGVASGCA